MTPNRRVPVRHRVVHWLKNGWPLFAFLLVVALHATSYQSFASHGQFVNKIVGAALQVTGAIIVLLSINANLGLFRDHGLWSQFIRWLREFPHLFRSPITGSLHAESKVGLSGGATLSTTVLKPLSDAARLEAMIAALELKLTEHVDTIHHRISETRNEILTIAHANQQAIHMLKGQMEEVTVGSFKQQVFGVLLAAYGAFVSVFA